MKVFAFLCLALLAVSVYSFNMAVDEEVNDDKVKINFYFESLCPYCQQFLSTALKVAMGTKDMWKICDFHLFPYGNARKTKVGTDDWSFTCQHGVKECEGNFIESCALGLYPEEYYSNILPFIVCLEESSYNWTTQGKKCATQHGVNWEKVESCSTSKQGRQFLAELGDATDNLSPAHTYVPWFTVNGEHSSSAESAIRTNMVDYVCSVYKGSEEIEACK